MDPVAPCPPYRRFLRLSDLPFALQAANSPPVLRLRHRSGLPLLSLGLLYAFLSTLYLAKRRV